MKHLRAGRGVSNDGEARISAGVAQLKKLQVTMSHSSVTVRPIMRAPPKGEEDSLVTKLPRGRWGASTYSVRTKKL